MTKEDITKTTITIGYKVRRRRVLTISNFEIGLQNWIKMSPDEQEKYVFKQANRKKVVDFDVIK